MGYIVGIEYFDKEREWIANQEQCVGIMYGGGWLKDAKVFVAI